MIISTQVYGEGCAVDFLQRKQENICFSKVPRFKLRRVVHHLRARISLLVTTVTALSLSRPGSYPFYPHLKGVFISIGAKQSFRELVNHQLPRPSLTIHLVFVVLAFVQVFTSP